jgi:hypothetical protein
MMYMRSWIFCNSSIVLFYFICKFKKFI